MPATEKRLVEDIIESELGGILSQAMSIHEIQVAAANFTDGLRDSNKPGRPVMWDVVDYHDIPRDFFDLLVRVADYKVTL